MESLFGVELSLPVKFFIAFAIVLGLIGAAAYLVRRFGAQALGNAVQRGRPPRLAVVDAAQIDNRRRLLIVRRDNVEHLILVGGPTDVLVEANIVRSGAVQGARDLAPIRTPAAEPVAPLAAAEHGGRPGSTEPTVRPKRADADPPSPWPLQHTAETAARPVPVVEPVPSPPAAPVMPIGAAAVATAVHMDVSAHNGGRSIQADEPQMPSPPRFVEEQPSWPAPAWPAPSVEPIAVPAQVQTASAGEEQNLADMAFRLEAALRRPLAADDTIVLPSRPVAPPEQPARMQQAPEIPPPTIGRIKPAPELARAPAAADPRHEPRHERPVYEGLEREMASLLGRPLGSS